MATSESIVYETRAEVPTAVHLVASRRKSTGHGVFPCVPDTSPSAPQFEQIDLSDTAVLYSYTVIHPNPKSGQPPFALAYVDFPEDVRVFGRVVLADGVRPEIGMRVQPVAAAEGFVFVPTEGVSR